MYLTNCVNYYTGTQNEPDSTIGWWAYAILTYDYFTYNSSRQITKRIQKKILTLTNIETDSTVYTYSAGNLASEDNYHIANGSITNHNYKTTTYNVMSQPLVITSSQYGDVSKLSYTYNLSGQVDMLITDETSAGGIKSLTKNRYTYTSSNDVNIDSSFIWNPAIPGWQILKINHYQYDAYHNQLVDSLFSNSNGSFRVRGKVTQTFDINNNMLTKLYEVWDSTSLKWLGDTLRTYTYQTYNPTNIQEQELKPTFKLYPNPSTHFIIADLANIAGIKDYAIYDMTGKLYRRAKLNAGTSTLTIPVADLSNGNYILSFYTDSSTLQQTFVKQ